jgi:hypothetical protein
MRRVGLSVLRREERVGKAKERERARGCNQGGGTTAGGVWTQIECALPGEQRGSAGGFAAASLMSCPGGAELGREAAGRMTLG